MLKQIYKIENIAKICAHMFLSFRFLRNPVGHQQKHAGPRLNPASETKKNPIHQPQPSKERSQTSLNPSNKHPTAAKMRNWVCTGERDRGTPSVIDGSGKAKGVKGIDAEKEVGGQESEK